jgi:hypothetical protein
MDTDKQGFPDDGLLDDWFSDRTSIVLSSFFDQSARSQINFIRVNPWLQKIKSKKKKVAFPRRTWQIDPVTRVKSSAKKYSRPCVKQDLHKEEI